MNPHHLQSHLAKAKGLGSSGVGTDHFIHQRISALALTPLVIWLAFSIAMLPAMSYSSLTAWVQYPFNSLLLIMLLISGFYHLQLGLQVILEDYISAYGLKLALIITVKLSCIGLSISGIYAVIKIALGP